MAVWFGLVDASAVAEGNPRIDEARGGISSAA
jgi:hypothetical protein